MMSISSKLAALSVTYPYQVVRSRIQVRTESCQSQHPFPHLLHKIHITSIPIILTPFPSVLLDVVGPHLRGCVYLHGVHCGLPKLYLILARYPLNTFANSPLNPFLD